MEAADSICYLVMDIEDGFNKKYYNVDFVIQYLESNGNEYVKQLIKKLFENVFTKSDPNIRNFENTKMVQLRVFLIKELVVMACKEFLYNLPQIMNGTYTRELIKNTDKDKKI
ncbi:MAG: hypothetical protein IPG78_04260 [Ignavibacteria bacterium]|nr:hypothetical protein [Ignavibacteria bacterium]